jgi:para-aminobenzoate synthetase/4-amino-4-deoxychorismate lyase
MPRPNISVLMPGDPASRSWLWFRHPVAQVTATRADGVMRALARVEKAVGNGLHAAGFVSYEAAPGWDKALVARRSRGLPLLWFGLFEGVLTIPGPTVAPDARFALGRWRSTLAGSEYARAIARIRAYLHAGDAYQVNYTMRLRAPFAGDPLSLFMSLFRAQPSATCAFVRTGRFALCSASPELFFRLDRRSLVAIPMKGTARRGRSPADDLARRVALHESPKDRAENVMIVDMVRNDMGRICRPGSVRALRLFDVETHPTVFQMTSTVCGRTACGIGDVLKALFPCASITGAPKVRAMQIIRELETSPRGVYTGCIGFVAPGGRARFNVAIRTVAVHERRRVAECGVGGGIVWDSNARDELIECRLKARFLGAAEDGFQLIETLRWDPAAGYCLLDRHMIRLANSARYFGFQCDPPRIVRRLVRAASCLPSCPHRVRLLLNVHGHARIEAERLRPGARHPWRLKLAPTPANSRDLFLYHKTTRRDVYESARAAAPDADDVLLWNERGEVTESTIANLVVERDDGLVTPRLRCGLLAGVFRDWLLESRQVREAVVTVDEAMSARRLYLVNSVRRWVPARLDAGPRRGVRTTPG